jgi:hypothetical protein
VNQSKYQKKRVIVSKLGKKETVAQEKGKVSNLS